jgi:ABC-type multidrug transport system fused ATPase/permease subunit
MRRQLYTHLLKLPQDFFRNTFSGLIVTALVTELATAGDFVGMAVAVPLVNLLTLAAFAIYLAWLDPLLAAVSFSVYPLVVIQIPRLQKRVNAYNRQRVDATRDFSGRLGESVDGIDETKVNDAFRLEGERLGALIERLRRIRITWNLYRFAIKVTNSLLTNFSRFLIFALGGYLALNGQLALGVLVAFLSAQEKLYTSWKELVVFYQAYQTAAVTYRRTMDFFDRGIDKGLRTEKDEVARLKGQMDVHGLTFQTADGQTLPQEASFSLERGEHMALVGGSGSGKSTLVHCLMGLHPDCDGRYALDGQRLADFTRHDLAANMGAVFQTPAIFSGSLEDNLLYACEALADDSANKKASTRPDLNARIEALQQADLFSDVLGFGLAARLDPVEHSHLQQSVLSLRRAFRNDLPPDAAKNVEPYAKDRYLSHASMAENLFFGRLTREETVVNDLLAASWFRDLLQRVDLWKPLRGFGARLVEDLVKEYGNRLIPTRKMPITAEEMPLLRRTADRLENTQPAELPERQQQMLVGITLRYIAADQGVSEPPAELTERIVHSRSRVKRAMTEMIRDAVDFYHLENDIESASMRTNIVFGQITSRDAAAIKRIDTCVNRLLVEGELLETIVAIGMQHSVGRAGENLSGGQRQKLALARALLKKPPILLLDEASASLDNESQERVQKMMATRWKGKTTLVAVVHRLDIITHFDRIAVMESGQIVEMGAYEKLMDRKGRLYQLVQKQR